MNLDVFIPLDNKRLLKGFEQGKYIYFLHFCYSSKLHACLSNFLFGIPTWMCHWQVRLNLFRGKFLTSFQIFSFWLLYSRIWYFLLPKCSCHNALVPTTPLYLIFFFYFVNTASVTGFKHSCFSACPLLSLQVQVTNFSHLHPCN